MEVKIRHSGDYQFKADSHSYSINIVPTEKAKDPTSSMSPLETFLVSVGACVGVYAVKYCHNAKIDTSALEIIVSGDLGQDKPVRFEKIKVKVKLGQDLGARKDSFLNFIKNCPIHNTLSHTPQIDFVF